MNEEEELHLATLEFGKIVQRLKFEALLETAESHLGSVVEKQDFRRAFSEAYKEKLRGLGGQMADQFHPKFGTWVQQAIDSLPDDPPSE